MYCTVCSFRNNEKQKSPSHYKIINNKKKNRQKNTKQNKNPPPPFGKKTPERNWRRRDDELRGKKKKISLGRKTIKREEYWIYYIWVKKKEIYMRLFTDFNLIWSEMQFLEGWIEFLWLWSGLRSISLQLSDSSTWNKDRCEVPGLPQRPKWSEVKLFSHKQRQKATTFEKPGIIVDYRSPL